MDDEDGVPHLIVGIPLRRESATSSLPEEKETVADIAVVLRDGEVVITKGAVILRDSTERISRMMSSESSDKTTITVTATSYQLTDGQVESRTQTKVIGDQPGSESGITTMKSAGCFSCQLVGDIICTVGCGIGVSMVCAGSAVANLAAGYGCTIIAGILCGIFTAVNERYKGASCNGDFGIEFACYYAGYCNKPLG